jgi:hypothetical protein
LRQSNNHSCLWVQFHDQSARSLQGKSE